MTTDLRALAPSSLRIALTSLEPTLGPAENEYRGHFLQADIAQATAGIIATLALAVLSVAAELYLHAAPPAPLFVGTRVFMLVLSVWAVLALRSVRSPSAFDRVSLIWMLGFVAQFLVLVATRPESPIDGVGLVIITLGIYIVAPTPLPSRAAVALFVTAGYLLVLWLVRHKQPPSFFVAAGAVLVTLHWIGASMSTRIHAQRRQQFTAQESLRASLRERDALILQLRQSRQMAALGRLAAGVAHDFNNVLGTMLVSVDLVLADKPDSVTQHADLTMIRDAVKRGADLTQQLLAFSRQEVLPQQVVKVNDLIVDTHHLLARTLGENVHIHLELVDSLAPIRADPGQIRQILLNLAINARDAMSGQGTLTIATRNVVSAAPPAEPTAGLPPGQYAALSVSDTGTGMDSETLARIFEPFFTTKPEGAGTGLGLAIVYGIVDESGAHIRVASEQGTATTFEIFFPATA